jgi:hypothetical protein
LTTSKVQAERFVRTAVIKSGRHLSSGVVNRYSFETFEGLHSKEFVNTSVEWLRCVCDNRKPDFTKEGNEWSVYDVLIGKIANDDTMATISIYLADGYGPRESESAVAMAIRLLKPERLKDQICLKSNRALERLCFLDSCEVGSV